MQSHNPDAPVAGPSFLLRLKCARSEVLQLTWESGERRTSQNPAPANAVEAPVRCCPPSSPCTPNRVASRSLASRSHDKWWASILLPTSTYIQLLSVWKSCCNIFHIGWMAFAVRGHLGSHQASKTRSRHKTEAPNRTVKENSHSSLSTRAISQHLPPGDEALSHRKSTPVLGG
jgi:hypothetical protein